MKFYLDIYLVVNFTMDFFLVCLTGRVLHMKTNPVRLFLSALCGALLALTPIFIQNAATLFLRPLIPAVMLFISFGKIKMMVFLKAYIMLLGFSFATGGIYCAAAELLPITQSPKILFAGSFLIFFFCYWFFDLMSISSDADYVDITVKKDGNEKKLRLMCDSGCLVKEPIGGLPVILLSPEVFDEFYPPESLFDLSSAIRLKKRMVPIHTAGGNSLICAVMPEKLSYIRNNKTFSCHAMVGRAQNDSFSGFDGIFPKSLLK